MLADPRVWVYTDDAPPASRAALRARYARAAHGRSPDGSERWLNWVVRRTGDGRAVGFVQATIGAHAPAATIAYVIGRDFWGTGVGTAAVRALRTTLRDSYGVAVLRATVDARNLASLAILRGLDLACVDARDPASLVFEGAS